MTPEERWRQVEAIVQAALDMEPGGAAARARFVAEACADDDEVREQVERLLAASAEDGASDFIESPAWMDTRLLGSDLRRNFQNLIDEQRCPPPAAVNESRQNPEIFIGRKIGAFELVKEIGRGGMGAVYLATRASGGFRQKAAVKLVRRGVDTDFIVRRFRRERQILAALEHPYVARLIDGGTTDDGLPYFVMEYVEGEPLYRFCGSRKLDLAARLELFLRVCEAVEAAHEAGVIHRDLKPSNILVKSNGKPKLLDFGIAKILDAAEDLASEAVGSTATEMRLMTPEYASPEQVGGGKITIASDIYSLGVLLYELIAGRRPYKFKNRAIHEIHRAVCETVPAPPSSAAGISDSGFRISDLKYVSGTIELSFAARAEDLDAITLKALRKNARERYQTVAALAEDIKHCLEDRPVSAEPFPAAAVHSANTPVDEKSFIRPGKPPQPPPPPQPSPPPAVSIGEMEKPTTGSREKTVAVLPLKFLRGGASGADDDFLGVGLADALVMKLSNVRRFVVRPTSSVLRYHETTVDPFKAGRELGVEFLVDGSIRQVGGKIRVNVQLLNVAENSTVWGRAFDEKYTDVLELEDAISTRVAESLVPHLTGEERHNLEKRGTNQPGAHDAYLRGRYHWNQMTAEGFAKSIEFYNRAIRLDPLFAAAHAGIAEYYSWMAVYGLLAPKESLAKAREAAEKAVALDDALAEAHAANGLALLTHETQWAIAEKRFRRAIELNENSASARILYACQLAMEGRFGEALREARRARVLDPLNPFNRYILAWCIYQSKDFDESIAEHRSLIEDEPAYGSGYFTMSWALRRTGRFSEAVTAARKAVELSGGAIPMISAALAAALAEAGRAEEAREILARLNADAAAAAAAGGRYVTPVHRALVCLHLGETEDAFRLLEEAVAESDPWTVWLGTEPQYDSLRADVRFQNLLARAKNPFAGRR